MDKVVIRLGGREDVEPAVAVWVAANRARREGAPPGPEQVARERGYEGAQLWTQTDNARARRLYEGRGFWPSGREKVDLGERIMHYRRDLS